MGRRGPLPDNHKLHKLKTGEDRYSATPKPAPLQPDPPKGMSTEARREWRRLATLLEPLGLLTRLDRDLLARYCENVVIRARLREQLDREGLTVDGYRGSVVKHPAWQQYREVSALLGADGDRLGLSPAARLRMPLSEPEPDEDSEISRFLTGAHLLD